jgi:hypothetical protein
MPKCCRCCHGLAGCEILILDIGRCRTEEEPHEGEHRGGRTTREAGKSGLFCAWHRSAAADHDCQNLPQKADSCTDCSTDLTCTSSRTASI